VGVRRGGFPAKEVNSEGIEVEEAQFVHEVRRLVWDKKDDFKNSIESQCEG